MLSATIISYFDGHSGLLDPLQSVLCAESDVFKAEVNLEPHSNVSLLLPYNISCLTKPCMVWNLATSSGLSPIILLSLACLLFLKHTQLIPTSGLLSWLIFVPRPECAPLPTGQVLPNLSASYSERPSINFSK